ncbi:MAG TPA: T9SS type A sorting domain-containing protein [Bacteroidales bacterium]|nr:T9SS type A sorting domain-containing protein [Bacteroidales bacterium]HSA44569.1 T9SS type A sorting domain-containing protein [Bacteroidales bacterium]
MKVFTYLLPLLMGVIMPCTAQNYHPFPDSNAIWSTEGQNAFTVSHYRFRYGVWGDTTIGGQDYKKVYALYDSTLLNPLSVYYAAVREDNQRKVWVLHPDYGEHLLYDFKMQLGDTIWYNLGGYVAGNQMFYNLQDHYKVVSAIDTVMLLNNQWRKRWTLVSDMMTDTWIEGLGSIVWFGLFNPLVSDYVLNGDMYQFTCFKQNNQVLYLDNPYCSSCFCTLITGLEHPKPAENGLKLYPVPAATVISVSLPRPLNHATITVYNSLGQPVRSFPLEGETAVLDIAGFQSGVYFIQIRSEEACFSGSFTLGGTSRIP